MRKNIIITGKTKSGKSTLLEKLISSFSNKVGIISKEVTADDTRIGFEIWSHNGQKTMLAHVDFNSPFKVGKFFVKIENLESILYGLMTFASEDLLYVDEIGQMQLISYQFQNIVSRFFNSPNICVVTLTSVYEDAFIRSIKQRDDIILIEITSENREEKELFVRELIKKIQKAKNYTADIKLFTMRDNHTVLLKSEHGIRLLDKQNERWNCDCSFFGKYSICSHSLAVEQFMYATRI